MKLFACQSTHEANRSQNCENLFPVTCAGTKGAAVALCQVNLAQMIAASGLREA